jgi:uncharacterized protein (TIGR00645 family)
MRQIERTFRSLIFAGRWLTAPFLVGLLIGVVLLLYRFFADLWALAVGVPTEGWHDLVVGILNLVDIALTANLILIVIFSGYENFIRKIELEEHTYLPAGLTDVDFGALSRSFWARSPSSPRWMRWLGTWISKERSMQPNSSGPPVFRSCSSPRC